MCICGLPCRVCSLPDFSASTKSRLETITSCGIVPILVLGRALDREQNEGLKTKGYATAGTGLGPIPRGLILLGRVHEHLHRLKKIPEGNELIISFKTSSEITRMMAIEPFCLSLHYS